MTNPADLKELGTLIVVVGKARNLPNKSRFGKQDPFCTVTVNDEKQKTKAIKRGGQHPEWDEELRFRIMEDVDDVLVRSESLPDTSLSSSVSGKDNAGVTTAAALANKSRKGPLQKKGGKSLKIACYADDAKEPELIGESVVGIDEVLKKGEVDEWYEFTYKDKYSGEVYLELTFYSNNAPPVKRNVPRPSIYTSTPTPPNGLSHSGSITGMSLYIPPYVPGAGVAASQSVASSSSFADLGLPHHMRKQSAPNASYPSLPSTSSMATIVPPSQSSISSIDALTRPISSMSISSSVSSRPLPPAAPAPQPVQPAYHGRHSLDAGQAPWSNLLPQHQPPSAPAPHPRPLSTNDVFQSQHNLQQWDEQRVQAATPLARPVSSQAYAPPPQDYRGPSQMPPSLQAGLPPLRPYSNSFDHTSPTHIDPIPTPPHHPHSAPPQQYADPTPPRSHYQIPTSSFAGIQQALVDQERAATPQPHGGYQQEQYPPQQSMPPSQSYQQQPPPQATYQPAPAPAWGNQVSPPRRQSSPAQNTGYVPWYQQTQSNGYENTPPPVPAESRPRPVPPARQSRGYYPSDELYSEQQEQQQQQWQPAHHHSVSMPSTSYMNNAQAHGSFAPPPQTPPRSADWQSQPQSYRAPSPSPHAYRAPSPSPQAYRAPSPSPQAYRAPSPAPPQPYRAPSPSPQTYRAPSPAPQPYRAPSPQPPSSSSYTAPYQTQAYSQSSYHPPQAEYQPTPPPPQPHYSIPPSSSFTSYAPPHPPQPAAQPYDYRAPSPQPAQSYNPPPQQSSYRAPSPQPQPLQEQSYQPNLPPPTSRPHQLETTSPVSTPPNQGKQDWRSYMQNIGSSLPARSPSPAPPPKDSWYTPPPSLPSSIKPPEGWKSTLPNQNSGGHQWGA